MSRVESPRWRPSTGLLAVAVLALALAIAAVAIWRGPTLAVPAQDGAAPPPAGGEGPGSDPAILAMVQGLEAKLAQQPDNAEGWAMLGRSYIALGRPADAVAAFRKRRELQSGDALALADLGDALAFAAGRKFDGEPEQLIAQALKIDPRNTKALELAGTMAFDRGQHEQAVRMWQQALGTLDAQSPVAMNLQAGIAEAQRRGGLKPTAGVGAQVSGRVVLAAALKSRVQPDDTVLISARLVDGPRVPVAVLERRASELPLEFKLDETSAVNPTLRLSPSMRVVVGARVSRTGQATPQAGDLQGYSQPVPVGTRGLQIEINDTVK